MDENDRTRRRFLGRIAAAGIGFPILHALPPGDSDRHGMRNTGDQTVQERLVCVFSKHLQFLDYDAMADAAAAAGFDGVDLTVRPGGHVLPQHAERDLPRAVNAVRSVGLEVPMMTTAIARVGDLHAESVLHMAADLGIRYYRMNWVEYDDGVGIIEHLRRYRAQIERLAALNANLGLHGAYQNHAGASIGAPVWDLHILLDGLDPAHIGVQYDIRHATVEGAHSWSLGFKLLHPYIKTLVMKDFSWQERDGRSHIVNVPLGEGMVDLSAYLDLVDMYTVSGPISVHFEYDMPGDRQELAPVERTRQTIDVMRRDVRTLRARMVEAGL